MPPAIAAARTQTPASRSPHLALPLRASGEKAGSAARAMRQAAVEFEAIMLKQLVSTMRQSGTFGSDAESAAPRTSYQDLFDGQIAVAMAQAGGVGIARMLEQQWASHEAVAALPGAGALGAVLDGAHISSRFGPRRDPLTGVPSFHAGVDLAAPEGSAVGALGDGQVVFAGESPGYGLNVVIDHGAGRQSRCAHLSALRVRAGQVVQTGERIGDVGKTGRSTGPHVHVELRVRGEPVDPLAATLPRPLARAARRD